MAKREGHGFWPYLAPMFLFLFLVELGSRLPIALLWKALLPGGLFLVFALRGSYPELRGYRWSVPAVGLDLLVGVLGGLLWMAPYIASDSMRAWTEGGAFDPEQLGAAWVGVALGLRVLGYGIVTPFVEEMFVRSWLHRYIEVFDKRKDFRDVPMARYTARSFWVVVVFFTISHVQWEWPVAIPWIIATQAWFYHRQHIVALILVHAGSNLGIFAFVLAFNGTFRDSTGTPFDLWFFL